MNNLNRNFKILSKKFHSTLAKGIGFFVCALTVILGAPAYGFIYNYPAPISIKLECFKHEIDAVDKHDELHREYQTRLLGDSIAQVWNNINEEKARAKDYKCDCGWQAFWPTGTQLRWADPLFEKNKKHCFYVSTYCFNNYFCKEYRPYQVKLIGSVLKGNLTDIEIITQKFGVTKSRSSLYELSQKEGIQYVILTHEHNGVTYAVQPPSGHYVRLPGAPGGVLMDVKKTKFDLLLR